MKNFLPIVLTCDDKYFKYASVVISSLLINSNKNTEYEINIISEHINNENKSKAREQIKNHHNFSIRFIELKNFDANKFYLNSYMSVSTYYRFYIPSIFKDYERILYLDCDLVVDADISNLATMDFENKLAICCSSPYIKKKIENNDDENIPRKYFVEQLKMPQPLEYFNAGVMLYNLTKMNELHIQDKLFSALDEIEKPIFQDQDILNSVLSRNGGVRLISNKYNMTRTFKITQNRIFLNALKRYFGMLSKKEQWFYIYHFVGKDKPWKKQGIDYPIFQYYAKKSPFYEEIRKENNLK